MHRGKVPVGARAAALRVALVLALALPLYAAGQALSPRWASAATSHATMVAVGQAHACAIVNGQAYCWGDNSTGELGNNNPGVSSTTAVPVNTSGALAGKSLASISAGDFFTCALDSAAAAYCWGGNGQGQLGINSTTNSAVPATVSGSHAFSQISASDLGDHTCAIDTGGVAWCWGLNTDGQLGNNSTTQALVPVAVSTSGVLAGKTLTRIAAGTSFSCALDSTGTAYCWGLNANGELGDNSTAQSLVPVAVSTAGVLAGKTLTEISAGATHACALDSTGVAYCWGQNSSGELGNNSTTQSLVPVAVNTSGVLAGKTLTEITAGDGFTCALDSTGKAYCWGDASQGQLGTGSFTSSPVPVAVSTSGVLAGVTLTQIDSGTDSTCALDTTGQVYCWGQNGNGELGNGTSGGPSTVPVKVVGLPAAGVLSITVPVTATLPSIAPGNTTSGQLGTVTVSDDRGVGSWTATVSCTVFSSGSHTIGLTQISYWSGAATATTGTGTFTPGQLTAANAVTLTTSRTAFSLTGGSAVNSASWDPTLTVTLPLSTVSGTYTATITHSVA